MELTKSSVFDSVRLPSPRGGGYSLIIAIRVCAAQHTRSYFWDSDLKRGIMFKPFLYVGTGYNFSNARKLQNIIGNFNSRTGY